MPRKVKFVNYVVHLTSGYYLTRARNVAEASKKVASHLGRKHLVSGGDELYAISPLLRVRRR